MGALPLASLHLDFSDDTAPRVKGVKFSAGTHQHEAPSEQLSWNEGVRGLCIVLIQYATGGPSQAYGAHLSALYDGLRSRGDRDSWASRFFGVGAVHLDYIRPRLRKGVRGVEIHTDRLPRYRITIHINNTALSRSELESLFRRMSDGSPWGDSPLPGTSPVAEPDAWIVDLGKTAQKLRTRRLQREFVLRSARREFNADYLFWGVGRYDRKAKVGVTLEFFDDADGMEESLQPKTNGPSAEVPSYLRYAQVAHRMNGDRHGGAFLFNLTKNVSHITVTQSDLATKQDWAARLQMLLRLGLLVRYRATGLADFMFCACRHDALGLGSGIGFHRSRKKPRFGALERDAAHRFSFYFSHLLHVISVDSSAIAPASLPASARLYLPLLLSDISDERIDSIVGARRSARRREATLAWICQHLQIEGSREALRYTLAYGGSPPGDVSADAEQAVARLLGSSEYLDP